MNRKAVKKWRDALRSGEYKQISGQCYDGYGFCVLGVCDRVVGKVDLKTLQERYSLSDHTTEKLGVTDRYPSFLGKDMSNLNDRGGEMLSFDEFADLLDIALIERDEIYLT